MSIEVITISELKRGCGYRKPAKDGVGIYLMGAGSWEPCERLPFQLQVCPACGEGVRFFPGVRWVTPSLLFDRQHDPKCEPTRAGHVHALCEICNPRGEKAILVWVGEKFYRVPESFISEAKSMGISKKVNCLPPDLKIGQTRIFLAHKLAVIRPNQQPSAGIFGSFVPMSVDLVISDPEDVPERATAIAERLGDQARIVVVERVKETRKGQLVAAI
jgi:hypothetical protein